MITENMKRLANDIMAEAQMNLDVEGTEGLIMACCGKGGEIFGCSASIRTTIILIALTVDKVVNATPPRVRAKVVDDICLAIHTACDEKIGSVAP